MPLLEIKRDVPKPRLIQMGQAPKVIEPPLGESIEKLSESLQTFQRAIETATAVPRTMAAPVPIPDAPLEPRKSNRGRPKKMAKEKDLSHESGGPDVIRKDDAGEQGAIGTHGRNAPAQEKVPESDKEDGGNA